jgi:hypothetical protein
MKSYKTLYLNDTDLIKFTFTNTHIHININTIELIRDFNEFDTTLNELKNEYNINNHSIQLIKNWYSKNYKKIFSDQICYITKYGRKINKLF